MCYPTHKFHGCHHLVMQEMPNAHRDSTQENNHLLKIARHWSMKYRPTHRCHCSLELKTQTPSVHPRSMQEHHSPTFYRIFVSAIRHPRRRLRRGSLVQRGTPADHRDSTQGSKL